MTTQTTARDRRKAAKLEAAIKDAAKRIPWSQKRVRTALAKGTFTYKRGHIYVTP